MTRQEHWDLTKQQRVFLWELAQPDCGSYAWDVLTGPEMAMARRLEKAGLIEAKTNPSPDGITIWIINDAGRAALRVS